MRLLHGFNSSLDVSSEGGGRAGWRLHGRRPSVESGAGAEPPLLKRGPPNPAAAAVCSGATPRAGCDTGGFLIFFFNWVAVACGSAFRFAIPEPHAAMPGLDAAA